MKNEILNILQTHAKGAEKAIKASHLAHELRLTEREVRLFIRELIREGHPVASSIRDPFGFYLAVTQEEKGRYVAQLKARIVAMFQRLHDFDRTEAAEARRQMEMF